MVESLCVRKKDGFFFCCSLSSPDQLDPLLCLCCVSAVSLLSGGLWTGSATGFLNKHEHR